MKAYKVLPFSIKVNWIHHWSELQGEIEFCEDGCWLSTGTKKAKGYAVATIRGHPEQGLWLVHRLTYMLFHRDEDIRYLQLHHTCPNHDCVNPDHLIPLSPREHSQLTREREFIRKIQISRDPVYQEALDEIRQLQFETNFGLG